MRNGNTGQDRPEIEDFISDCETDLKAYDQLDPRLREFLRNLPMNFAAEQALFRQITLGVEETLNSGKEMLAEYFPGWTPI